MGRQRFKVGLMWIVEQAFGAKFANILQTLCTLLIDHVPSH